MKVYTFKLLFFLTLILSVNINCLGKQDVVYVSSTTGNDSNPGTKGYPLHSINVAIKRGKQILLKRGDVFYESIKLNSNILDCYGKGPLPKICGWKRIKESQWTYVGDSIWKISLKEDNYTGFDTSKDYLLNNIGCIHEYDKDLIHGRKVKFKKQLIEDWDIWQTEKHGFHTVAEHDLDSLYLRYSGNPNLLRLEFSVGTVGIRAERSIIKNIRVEGFGLCGIAPQTNTNIIGCEVDAIGGMTQRNENEFVSLGNGIEFWLYKDTWNSLVQSCIVSRCYDCGMTIQGQKRGAALPHNIVFRKNVIIDCCQGWEDFLNNENPNAYDNCRFENNIVINSGKTSGFNYPPRMKYCHVLGNNMKVRRGMIIKNNVFIGGNYYCSGACSGAYNSNIWDGNVCYIKRGDYLLSDYLGWKDVLRVPTGNFEESFLADTTNLMIKKYRELTGDMSTRFIIIEGKDLCNKINKVKNKYRKR